MRNRRHAAVELAVLGEWKKNPIQGREWRESLDAPRWGEWSSGVSSRNSVAVSNRSRYVR